jgi:hypothetical protein
MALDSSSCIVNVLQLVMIFLKCDITKLGKYSEYSKMEPGLPDPNESIFLAFIFTIVKVGG